MSGLPFHAGKPLLCDATVRSPLTGNGLATPGAARRNGAALQRAEQQKVAKYGDVTELGLCHLLTLGTETGGRCNDTVLSLVDKLSTYKAQYAPEVLRRSVALSWRDRWASMLGIAVQNAIAASLLAPTGRRLVLDQSGAPTPDISTVLDGQRWAVDHSVLPILD